MTIEQTVEIPANHRLYIDVPREVPVGKTILTFTPVSLAGLTQPQTSGIETIAAGFQSCHRYGYKHPPSAYCRNRIVIRPVPFTVPLA
jgi:hypothetical protein